MALAQKEQHTVAVRSGASNSTVEYSDHVLDEILFKGWNTTGTFQTVLDVLLGTNIPHILVFIV